MDVKSLVPDSGVQKLLYHGNNIIIIFRMAYHRENVKRGDISQHTVLSKSCRTPRWLMLAGCILTAFMVHSPCCYRVTTLKEPVNGLQGITLNVCPFNILICLTWKQRSHYKYVITTESQRQAVEVHLVLTLVTVMKSGPKNTLFTPSISNRFLWETWHHVTVTGPKHPNDRM